LWVSVETHIVSNLINVFPTASEHVQYLSREDKIL
jgi:hypothetical protein